MTYQDELDARYEAWQREQTLASLDDCGIILPMDTSSAAWRRDYGVRSSGATVPDKGSARVGRPGGKSLSTESRSQPKSLTRTLSGSVKEGNALIGVVNVAKFYLCCALIVCAVIVAVKVVAK